MSKRTTKHTLQQRLAAVIKVKAGTTSLTALAQELNVAPTTIKTWLPAYQHQGIGGLKERHFRRTYPIALKRAAVRDYREHRLSLRGCCDKYNISSDSVLQNWLDAYNKLNGLPPTRKGRKKMKPKTGRKTTTAERQAIVQATLAHHKDYQTIATKYSVSYSQVYYWVRQYERFGPAALTDHRGQQLKDRPTTTLTDYQQLQRKHQQAEARNQDLMALQ